jgi:hypothetical protein
LLVATAAETAATEAAAAEAPAPRYWLSKGGASGRRVELVTVVAATAGLGVWAGGGEGVMGGWGLEGLQMLARLCREFQPLDAELVRVLQKPPDCNGHHTCTYQPSSTENTRKYILPATK